MSKKEKNLAKEKLQYPPHAPEGEVYLDSCKTTRLDPEVLKEMIPYFTKQYWYPGNFTSIGTSIAEKIEESQELIAKTINGRSFEIIFTTGGTDSNNIAIKGIMRANKDKGKHFITSVVSHPSVLAVFQALEEEGFEGTYISADRDGYLNLEQLQNSIRDDTILVAFTHINHILGTIQKANKISEILKRQNHKIYFFLDSCEAYTKIPINVSRSGIDALSISGHKFNGPKGSGVLYIKDGTNIIPVQHGIVRLNKLKPGSVNVPNIVGITKAAEIAFKDFEKNIKKYRKLQRLLYQGLRENITDIKLNGPPLHERSPAHLNITFSYVEGEAIMMMLDFKHIHVETGSACSSQTLEPNYILIQTGRTHEESHSSVRFTFDRFVTEKSIKKTVHEFKKIIKQLRNQSPLVKNNRN